MLAGEQGVERVAGIVSLDVLGELGVIDAPLEAEFAIFVVDEDVGSGDGTEDAGDFLGGAIVEVGEVEALVLGANLHVGQGVTDVGPGHFIQADGVGIVGVQSNDGDALGAVILGELDEAFFVALGGGAVVAGKDDAKKFGVFKGVRGVGFTVGPGQLEVREVGAELLGFGHIGGAQSRGDETEQNNERKGRPGHGQHSGRVGRQCKGGNQKDWWKFTKWVGKRLGAEQESFRRY